MREWRHSLDVLQTRGIEIAGFEVKPVSRTQSNADLCVGTDKVRASESRRTPRYAHLVERLEAKAMRTAVYPMSEPWLDVGRPDDLNRGSTENSN